MLTACIRDPLAWLVRRQVSKGRSDARRVVFKQADSGIAAGAQKTAHRASLMVVIYSQALLYARVGLGYAQALTDRAATTLSVNQCIVFMRLYTKSFFAASIRAKSVVLLAIIRSPRRLLIPGTCLAKALKAIDLSCRLEKLALALNRLAGAAPLHSFWRFRAARGAAVVSPQVTHGLALDPPQALSVPGCNWRWSATPALAQAFRYFGHHASPLLAGFANNIRGKR